MRLTTDRANLALAAAAGNFSAAARALGCTVALLRDVLGAPARRRGRKPVTPPADEARAAYARACATGDAAHLAPVGGVRAVARAIGVPEATIRRKVARKSVGAARG